jgi:hypothetical protein
MKILMTSEDISSELGYDPQTLRNYLGTADTVLEGLPIFKLCRCKSRAVNKRCNHPIYMTREDFNVWISEKKESYGRAA